MLEHESPTPSPTLVETEEAQKELGEESRTSSLVPSLFRP